MTKSAVRAMDAITAFMASPAGGAHRVARFVVSGASKRGWTTWTTAAVDRRVIAIAPEVIDLLNVEPSFVHHWQAYGKWSEAVQDYVDRGLMDWIGTPTFRALMQIEEPYEYRNRLTMPKLLLNAAGDQFFLPDSSRFYFDDLPGEKLLRYIPNADHSLDKTDVFETLEAFYTDDRQYGATTPRPVDVRKRRHDQSRGERAAARSSIVAGRQPDRAQLPPRRYRAGLPQHGPHALRPQHVGGSPGTRRPVAGAPLSWS